MDKNLKLLLENPKFIILIGFVLRIIVIFRSISHDHPDTTWQGTEIAFYLIHPEFDGFYFPWEFRTATRSYIWPLFLTIPISFILFLGIQGLIIFHILRLLASILFLYGLLCLNKMLRIKFDEVYVSTIGTWIFSIGYPFVYMSTKISVDGVAASLALIFTCQYIIYDDTSNLNKKNFYFLGLILGLTLILRPQYIILWLFIIFKHNNNRYFVIGITTGLIPIIVADYIYYNIPGITYWNFFKFNILENQSGSWGSQPFYYYFLVILPIYFGFATFFMILCMIKSKQNKRFENFKPIFFGGLLYFFIFSIIPSKEFSLIYPSLLMGSLYSLGGIIDLKSILDHSPRRIFFKFLVSLTLFTSLFGLIVISEPEIATSNLWSAQQYVHENYPDQYLGIMGTHSDTGGNLLQYPDGDQTFSRFHYLDEIGSVIENLSLIILNSNDFKYQVNLNSLFENCTMPKLVIEFKERYVFRIFDNIGLDFLDFVEDAGFLPKFYLAEVWQCNSLA